MDPEGKEPRTAAPKVWTIPAGRQFAKSLVRGILARHAPSADLSGVTIYVPTVRAASALTDLFVSESAPRTLLLPDIRPLGDVGEDEHGLGGEGEEGRPVTGEIPPAIPSVRRRMLLARLVHAMRKKQAGGLPEAARLAGDLMHLLDTLHHEGLDLDDLDGIVEGEVADHWQETLKFLAILRDHWPKILEGEGKRDPARRQRELLLLRASSWERNPPPGPVIVAGSTGTVRAVRELMFTVTKLPKGELVLPGLDRGLDETSREALDETHPQYALIRLLRDLGVSPDDVRDWPDPEAGDGARARTALLTEAMRPADTAGLWPETAPRIDRAAALRGLEIVEAADTVEEAGVIALLMRETLETPGKTCALVTPDRELARRVRTTLRRWRIEVEDSAGELLSRTQRATLVRLAARAGAEGAGPVPLLALLKHPLAAGGIAPTAFRRNVRGLERFAVRGLPPRAGLKDVRRALRRGKERTAELLAWFDGLAERMEPLLKALGRRKVPAVAALDALRAFVEWLAGSDGESGADVLYADIDGNALSRFLEEFARAAPGLGDIRGVDWPALLDAALEGEAIFPPHPSHPRLSILSPIEARMLGADRVIAGGLVEGTWPRHAPHDPWLGRRMRRDLGLPTVERRVGLAAHDFVDAASASETFLTYARKTRGTPTVPARWITRLRTVLEAAGAEKPMPVPVLGWWKELVEAPPYAPIERPAPAPPLAARPRELSVTRFRRLVQEPYAAYGAHVLKLYPLEELAPEPGPREFGIAAHEAFEKFTAECGDGPLPPDALERLLDRGERIFRRFRAQPATHAFWIRRFRLAARWFLGQETEARRAVRRVWAECRGVKKFKNFPNGPFTLTARADRIEERTDGSLAILDYKTGVLPSRKAVDEGQDPQLPLSALIAEEGGFKGVPAAAVSELAYWRLTGRGQGGEFRGAGSEKTPVERLKETARALLEEEVTRYDDPGFPYRAVDDPEPYSDYVDLARVREWAVAGIRDEEEE